MISLHAIEAVEHTRSVPSTDDKLSRILDCAEADHMRGGVMYFRLRKALPGLPAGTLLTLARLHSVLFG